MLIDVQLHTVALDDAVARSRLFLPPELVRHSRAPAADHADAQAPLGLALLEAQVGDLLGGRLRQRDHARTSCHPSGVNTPVDCTLSQYTPGGQEGQLLERGARG